MRNYDYVLTKWKKEENLRKETKSQQQQQKLDDVKKNQMEI